MVLHDPVHNPGRETMHGHFIIKALHLTRPGGLCAVITSRYTLDARNPSARATMAGLADLVAAVRLPSSAHRVAAGTDVVTDMVILRRREPGRSPTAGEWLATTEVEVQGQRVRLNDRFVANPAAVLGTLGTGSAYRSDDLEVRGPLDVEDLAQALAAQVNAALAQDLGWQPGPQRVVATAAEVVSPAPAALKEGSITHHDGAFARKVAGVLVAHPVAEADRAELAALLGLRDTLRALLDVQASATDDAAFAALQTDLNGCYDAYASRWGALNRSRWARTGKVDPDTGEERLRRVRPRMGGFRDDPDAPSVFSLESYDAETQTATKAAAFHRRLLRPRHERHGADSAADALAICLDEQARVDLARVASLLGVGVSEARAELGELV